MSTNLSRQAENRLEQMAFLVAHTYPGRLIAAEGLDGSGKSTQLQLLGFWLRSEGYEVIITEWSPSKLIRRALKAGKKHGALEPRLLSILHAADLAELYQRDIVPALERGAIVLTDRYIYTALARDLARGVERNWIEQVYHFATRPNLCAYFQINADEALSRTLSSHPHLKYYQAGMDLGLSPNPLESFRAFQQRILQSYETMIVPYALFCLDATLPVKQQQQLLREAVGNILPPDE